jgi:hypothetical protein
MSSTLGLRRFGEPRIGAVHWRDEGLYCGVYFRCEERAVRWSYAVGPACRKHWRQEHLAYKGKHPS